MGSETRCLEGVKNQEVQSRFLQDYKFPIPQDFQMTENTVVLIISNYAPLNGLNGHLRLRSLLAPLQQPPMTPMIHLCHRRTDQIFPHALSTPPSPSHRPRITPLGTRTRWNDSFLIASLNSLGYK